MFLITSIKQVIYSIFIYTALLVTLNGCALKGNGKPLKVAVRNDVPGFGFKNENDDHFYGFEVDVAKAVAECMEGYDGVELYGVDSTSRDELLSTGMVDCVIACYEETPERADKFTFSVPYYYDSSYLLVEKSLMFNELLPDETVNIGIISGTNAKEKLTGSQFLNLPRNIEITEFQTYQDGIKMLETGEIDAVFSDGCILHQFKSKDRQMIKLESESDDVIYKIATQKGSDVSYSIDNALNSLINDGTIEELRAEWLDHS